MPTSLAIPSTGVAEASDPARNRSIGRMRILVAPDKFRGTLTARQAAEAIAAGWRRTRPRDRLDLAPMADGGEGTAATLVDALGGELVPTSVHGPLNDPVEASFGVAETAEGRIAIVEMAAASGLAMLAPSRRDPRIDHDQRHRRSDRGLPRSLARPAPGRARR